MLQALFVGLLAAEPPEVRMGSIDVVAWKDQAYLAEPGRVIPVDGFVEMIRFNEFGTMLLATGTERFSLADALQGKAKPVGLRAWAWTSGWTARQLGVQSEDIEPAATGPFVIERRQEETTTEHWVHDARTGAVSRIPGTFKERDWVTITQDGRPLTVQWRDGDMLGQLLGSDPIRLARNVAERDFRLARWISKDEVGIVLKGQPPISLVWNLSTGGIKKVTLSETLFALSDSPLTVDYELTPAQVRPSVNTEDWPEADKGTIFGFEVPRDITDVTFNAKGDRMAYIFERQLVMRSLVKVPYALAERYQMTEARKEAVSMAKQMALAVIMYSGDHDLKFPPGGAAFGNAVMPYVKDSNMVQRFVFLLGGKSEEEIEAPSDTPMGYVLGPGGRAVAFADGSVRWIPDR